MIVRQLFVFFVLLGLLCAVRGMQSGGGAGNPARKDWMFRIGEDGEGRVNRTRPVPVLRLGDSVDSPYVGFGFVSVPPVVEGAMGLHRRFKRALTERGLQRHLVSCVSDVDCDFGLHCRDFLFGKFCAFEREERELQPATVPVPVRAPEQPGGRGVSGSLLVM